MKTLPFIIIVDDDDLEREVVAMVAKEAMPKACFLVCSKAGDVLRQILLRPPDLLITDCQMPGMDGPMLVRAVRDLDLTFPIIMASGSDDARRLGENAGIDKFVSKVRVSKELPIAMKAFLEKAPDKTGS